MNRRQFIKQTAILGLSAGFYPATDLLAKAAQRKLTTIILGIDGMDIKLASTFMRMGLLPNFSKLAQTGSLTTTATSFPPQSPVAWSSLSIGATPAVHGIYDFIHRDPATMLPYLSTSKVTPPQKTLSIGNYEIPLVGGQVENLRKGKPFWDYLADYDIPTTIFKMPGNFPCQHKKVDMVSGMGTPDLRGGYGSFTLFTTSPPTNQHQITGGNVVQLFIENNYARSELAGPENTLLADHPSTSIPLQVWRDKKNAVVRLIIQQHELILNQGEWSDWLQLSFPMVKHLSNVKGICKVFIKSVHPELSIYVSPINIDPSDPVLPFVSSSDYGKELSSSLGAFYTQGMPEDTKALSYDVLDNQEYLELAYQIIDERKTALNFELSRLAKQNSGLLFFYFSSLDQDSHMFWRAIDPKNPLYTPELESQFGKVLRNLYIEMDKALGEVLATFDIHDPNFRLLVMSDHGFGPFRRQVNLNSWLYEQGFIALHSSRNIEQGEYFSNVNWQKTSAYALGINAIYLNLQGRDKFGSVSLSQANHVINKIRTGLLGLRDPESGRKVVSNIFVVPAGEKQANPHAPDLIIGWNYGYRTSWASILGGFEREVIKDNLDKWSGDHCIDPALIPAILFSNKRIERNKPSIYDITATILDEYGISVPTAMKGQTLFRPSGHTL